MKRFVIKTLLFFVPVVAFTYVLFKKANGYTDEFYLRFTSSKQTSLILGTSRAAQGLNPDILNKELSRNDIYNYSFTVAHSPYGPVYLNSIKRKLADATKDGVFILTVDPWSISAPNKDPNDASEFRENDLAVGRTTVVNLNPNVFYLIDEYRHPFYKLLQNSGEMFLHSNGWLEVTVPMDSVAVNTRIQSKIEEYRAIHVPVYHFSQTRLQSLNETIAFLKEHGTVYLVRLPVHHEMLKLDNNLVPDFNGKMNGLSARHGISYFDLTPLSDQFQYTDGNHLHKSSGEKVGEAIASLIAKQALKQ